MIMTVMAALLANLRMIFPIYAGEAVQMTASACAEHDTSRVAAADSVLIPVTQKLNRARRNEKSVMEIIQRLSAPRPASGVRAWSTALRAAFRARWIGFLSSFP
ncbi:hypothetical protein [Novosphingobium sp.]|uniref:hypothetical protein n=1 Tax=Novosphingobium sp. TaxID=1874826 RepID=UPI003D0F063E